MKSPCYSSTIVTDWPVNSTPYSIWRLLWKISTMKYSVLGTMITNPGAVILTIFFIIKFLGNWSYNELFQGWRCHYRCQRGRFFGVIIIVDPIWSWVQTIHFESPQCPHPWTGRLRLRVGVAVGDSDLLDFHPETSSRKRRTEIWKIKPPTFYNWTS